MLLDCNTVAVIALYRFLAKITTVKQSWSVSASHDLQGCELTCKLINLPLNFLKLHGTQHNDIQPNNILHSGK